MPVQRLILDRERALVQVLAALHLICGRFERLNLVVSVVKRLLGAESTLGCLGHLVIIVKSIEACDDQ